MEGRALIPPYGLSSILQSAESGIFPLRSGIMEWHVKRGISAGHLRGVDANYRGSVAVEDVRTEPVRV